MKVTVNFGETRIVVPCKDGWMVRDLIDQATQRYKKIVEQDGEFLVRTHHVEYEDGGILDPDDMLTDLVEDKDKLKAVYEKMELQQRAMVSPGGSVASGRSSPAPSEPELSVLQPYLGSEIEVTTSALKSTTPLSVRSSSDPALAPPLDVISLDREDISRPQSTGVGHATTVKGGAMDKPKVDVPNSRNGQVNLSSLTRTVEISGDLGPLGIKVISYCSSLSGRTLGLHIRSIEENSRSERERIFQEDECIVLINDIELIDKSFAQSQEVFRQAMSSSTVRLEVLPVANKLRYEKSLIGQLFNNTEPTTVVPKVKSPFLVHKLRPSNASTPSPEPPASQTPPLKEEELRPARHPPAESNHRRHTPSPPVSASPTLKDRSESPAPKKTPALAMAVDMINKRPGKKMKIDLKKGTEGLGFTVVTRDSSLHGPGPIMVKSILPRGAAVKDGRLKSGDRILEVNGVDITGRTQEELVAMLRSTKLGETVSMIVGRQEEFLPRELKGEPSGPLLAEDGREQLMFEVPLNDSGSAGLGVSLKGNKSRETGEDLGIFIKSIIHGGAAHKDGRLRINDQLVAVNSESLLGRSNHDAMETLRYSMSTEGNLRGTIQLVVLRTVERSPAQENQETSQTVSRNDSPVHHHPNNNHTNSSIPPSTANNRMYEAAPAPHRSYGERQELPEEDYDEDDFPPPPSDQDLLETDPPHKHQQDRAEMEPVSYVNHPTNQQYPQQQKVPDYPTNRSSKSMDLVADESNMASIQGQRPEPPSSNGTALGPRLGLQKSSSLESLQTAMEEVSKDEVPFHRPRAHMVRGRGCNLSFRYAIDKSYEGPSEPEDDDSEEDSGRDTPASGSSRQDDDKKVKKKKTKKKKEKKSKKRDEPEDPEKKTKKKGFGLLSMETPPDLRSVQKNKFGRKNKEEKAKSKAKQLGALSEEEMDRSEPEMFLSKSERNSPAPDRVIFPDVEDDDMDPNYARISNFREPPASSHSPYPPGTPTHNHSQPSVPAPNREPPNEDELEGLYAKVNKQRTAPPKTDSNEERLQQIRNQLQKVRPAPSYEDLTARRRQEYDPSRIRGPDPRMAPRYNDTDRLYASVPRRMPVEDYPNQNWSSQRDLVHYSNPIYETHRDNYPSRSPRLPVPRPMEATGSDYPSPPVQQRGPIRQDVPPSSNPGARGPPRYETLNQGNYRTPSPDRYGPYGDEQYQDPRQKNPIGAV
ncbi:par-3 family cell polarity regulator beta a isoform X1 [Ctenopharyngodon idella]|uniref:par-3 family cell polarity regulator beta a isoform X1 n=1 Tax=Ctenopharyngodon idella TaxID=7959 RepID=UPI00222E30A1|nr:par-3 family cell polarity regulator beta a isoform X1 [Ctenopharyngodon idella]